MVYNSIHSNSQSEFAAEINYAPNPGADLLNEITLAIRRYLALVDGGVETMALWAAHSSVCSAFEHTPRLHFTSILPGSGKSTALKVLKPICNKALKVENITPAALFRLVEARQLTLLIDETDGTLSMDRADQISLLNSGFEKGGKVARCGTSESNFEPELYEVFGPVALAGIGQLPAATLASRCITILMQPLALGEQVERFRSDRADHLIDLGRRVAEWLRAHEKELTEMEPEMPEGLSPREQDKWRPLFAVADLAGGPWPETARRAALLLSPADEEPKIVTLLRTIRDVFAEMGRDQLFTEELISMLKERECYDSDKTLARTLKPLGIEPKPLRDGGEQRRGYRAEWFRDAWSRYLPQDDPADHSA